MRSTPKGYSRWMLSQRAICSFPLWLETLLKAAVPHKARIGPSLVPPLSREGWGFLKWICLDYLKQKTEMIQNHFFQSMTCEWGRW